jgi:hypothetical protein
MQNIYQQKEREKRDKEIKKLYPILTMEEIATKFKLTRKRISQIIKGRQKINN